MTKPLKEPAKKHIHDRHIPEDKLTDDVVDALNAFSDEELKKVDKLGDALMDDGMLDSNQKISAVH
ncbi:MAG TPA: hypothetical protein VHU60_07195 [Gaiellaceae bacterium]|jgi:hypothetical protein|nr:hypothetical protein [Gaiellaceae bacterium]